ncbi:MAG: hypothetical protein ACYC5K_10540, partial [Saccharofermentanales bacterium]
QTLSIPSSTRYKEESKEFLKFFCSAENMAKISAAAFQVPCRTSSTLNEEVATDDYGWKEAVRISKEYRVTPEYAYLPTWDIFTVIKANTLYTDYINSVITIDQLTTDLETEGGRVLRKIR